MFHEEKKNTGNKNIFTQNISYHLRGKHYIANIHSIYYMVPQSQTDDVSLIL